MIADFDVARRDCFETLALAAEIGGASKPAIVRCSSHSTRSRPRPTSVAPVGRSRATPKWSSARGDG